MPRGRWGVGWRNRWVPARCCAIVLPRIRCSTTPTAALSALAVEPEVKPWVGVAAADDPPRGFTASPPKAGTIAMVTIVAPSRVSPATLAPVPHLRRRACARTLARSGLPELDSSRSRSSRSLRPEAANSPAGGSTVGSLGSSTSHESPSKPGVAAVRLPRRSQICACRTRDLVLGPGRRARLRHSFCAALEAGSGSPWRQSSRGAARCRVPGSATVDVLSARPVICPVSRSVSYHSSSVAPAADAYSSRRSRRTVASGGGFSDRLPLPDWLSMGAQIR